MAEDPAPELPMQPEWPVAEPRPAEQEGYERGNFVFIHNTICHMPITHRATTADRAGRVTSVTQHPPRVYLTMFNGYETWRHPDNIHRIMDQEEQEIQRLVRCPCQS